MFKLPDTPCIKCGGETSIHFMESTGMDTRPTGMKRTCSRCGYSEFIKALDEEEYNEA